MATVPRGHRMSPLDHEPAAVLYARKQAGLTQAQAVEQIPGINSTGHLSEIEKGTRNARPQLIKEMARVYNIPAVMLQRKIYASGGAA